MNKHITSVQGSSKLGNPLLNNQAANVTQTILYGQQDNSKYSQINLDTHGHLEVAIHGPINPFGSIHCEKLTPIFQVDGTYVLNSLSTNSGASNGGSATISNSSFVCNTTVADYGNAFIQTRKRLRYRAGQGSVIRFTGLFTEGGATGTYQVIGAGHAEDGYYFAWKDTTFGILYNERGVREIRCLEVTTASSHSENITITLNGIATSVAVTNSANINRTAWEISIATYAGWKAEQRSQYVYFINDSVNAKSSSYSLSGATSAIGTFTQIKAGVAATETFIPQTTWNHDTMDGTTNSSNPSGVLLDTSKFNVYQIGIKYLGAGAVTFSIETVSNNNNSTWNDVHTIVHPNARTQSTLGNPSFAFTMSAYKLTASSTDLTVKCTSVLGAIEGEVMRTGVPVSYLATNSALGNSAIYVLFMIRNSYVFNGRSNQAVIILNSLTAAARGGNNVLTTIYVIRNPTIIGNPTFTEYDSGKSCSLYTAATGMTCTYSNNTQLLFSMVIAESGNTIYNFRDYQEEFDVQPGEYIAICAQATSGTSNYVRVGLNTREDH